MTSIVATIAALCQLTISGQGANDKERMHTQQRCQATLAKCIRSQQAAVGYTEHDKLLLCVSEYKSKH